MGVLAGVAATVHAPYLTAFPERVDAEALTITTDGFTRLGAMFSRTTIDGLLVVTCEHIVNLEPRLVPPFTIGVGERHPVFHEPHFRLPAGYRPGDPELGRALHDGLTERGFDIAHSVEVALDHGTMVPLELMQVEAVPVVPVVINTLFAPLPSLRRCAQLGTALAAAIEAAPGRRRIGVLATGGLSHTVGAPGMDRTDAEFDARFLEALADGDLDRLTAFDEATLDAAGNGTHEIRTWITAAAAASGLSYEVVTALPHVAGWDVGVHQVRWTA